MASSKKLTHRLAVGVAAMGVAASALVAAPPAATAAGNTYLWTNGSSTTRVYALPNTQKGVRYINVKNGMRFQMWCWLDNAGHRWFYGTTFSGYIGYVTAGPVRNQTKVRRC